MNALTLILILLGVAAIVALVALIVVRQQKFSKLPPEIRAGISRAQGTRAQYHHALRDHKHRVSAAEHELKALEDPKGRPLKAMGGAALYERWIDTPQGGGSLIGVTATAEDDTTVTQRLTVTRMVAFGVFSLAATEENH